MLADHGIGRIGQAEFLQPSRAGLARHVANAGSGKETVENDLL